MSVKSLKDLRILIVDDDREIRETLFEILVLEGSIVTEASDGNQAFEMMKNYDYNVVLSDIRMPQCSGVDLLKRVRAEKDFTSPPILLMSAFTDISASKAKQLGAQGMFLKDSDSKHLKEMLMEAARK